MSNYSRKVFQILLAIVIVLGFLGSFFACEDNPVPTPDPDKKEYTVMFIIGEMTVYKTYKVKEGEFASPPEKDPELEGFKFAGWQIDGIDFDFKNTPITKNTVIQAKWRDALLNVIFRINDEKIHLTVSVEEGKNVTRPENDPVLPGFEFAGWHIGGADFDFEKTPIMAETVIWARWNECFYGVFGSKDFVKTDGNKLRKNWGKGDEIFSYGVNNGGHLLVERYKDLFIGSDSSNPNNSNMTGGGINNHINITNKFFERFGKERTLELWKLYRDNFWTDADWEICKDMKINTIRLPFGYWTIDSEFNNVPEIPGQKYNFSILDEFVSKAAENGIYIILDLHGAYGSQSGQDHTGQDISSAANVDFYRNEINMSKTLDLWRAVATRYNGNPVIMAYDTLNEPSIKGGAWGNADNPTATVNQIHDFLNRCYQTIREVDQDHIVMIETCWEGDKMQTLHQKANTNNWNWNNVWYSFHHYTSETSNAANHKSKWDSRVVTDIPGKAFYKTVPVHMGEYSCYNNQLSWEQSHATMKQYNWSWSMWTYKVSKNVSGWGIVHTYPNANIDVGAADEATIRAAFESLKTNRATLDSGSNNRMYFYKFSTDGTDTLFNVLKTICGAY